MKNVFISGASGFLGRALAQSLVNDGHRVISLVRDRAKLPPGYAVVFGDVRDGDLMKRIIADYEIDTIYHLAAQSIVSACAEDPISALDVGVMGTARLLNAVKESGRKIVTVCSTSDKSFGHSPSPYDESSPLDARHSYEVSKACQDLVARMFFYNYGLDVRVLRAVNIYGPGDPNDSRLVPKTILRMLNGERPLLHENAGNMRRQYVYIDDCVNAFKTVCERGKAGEVYCVGSLDEPKSVLEVMQTIWNVARKEWIDPDVKVRDSRFQEIMSQSVKDDKIRGLGWKPIVGFEDGIKRTIEWYSK